MSICIKLKNLKKGNRQMNQDPSKMYKFLEVLNMYGPPAESSIEKKARSNMKNKQIYSSSYQSNKCDGQCVDCFSVFCRKEST